jgi:ribosomal protein S25
MKCIDWFYREVVTRGMIRSLYQFSEREGINYWHARRCLKKLEDRGLVDVERRPGYPLVIKKTGGDR